MQVRLSGFQKEIGFSGETEKQFNKIDPALSVVENGKVSYIGEKFLVFNNRAIFLTAPDSPKLKLKQECEYEAIASNHCIDGREYKWRVVDLKKVNGPEKIEGLIEMTGLKFSIAKSNRSAEKFVLITNHSTSWCCIKRISINSTSHLIELKKSTWDFRLRQKLSRKAYFLFFPKDAGHYLFNIVADFETRENEKFSKECVVEVDVYNEYNICIKEKARSAPRFQEISFKVYFIPSNLRTINAKNTVTGIEKLRETHPVCIEELNKGNYLTKLHIGIYLEEIALEIAFQNYNIERDRFVREGELLKLQVKDVAEKRPSICIGDKLVARKLVNGMISPEHQTQIIIVRITKVCDDFVLLKFPKSSPEGFLDHDYSIDFEFSRTNFIQQHHAIDTVTSSSGLGLNFLFPDEEYMKANPRHYQIDAELQEGKLMRYAKELKWFNSSLNINQKEAIVNILRGECRPLPYIIYGPPGEFSFD